MSASARISCSPAAFCSACRRSLAVPIAGIVAALLALPVSVLVFRLRGAYFAIGTWVVAEVFRLVAAQMTLLGGGSGVSLPIAIVKIDRLDPGNPRIRDL